MVRMQTTRSQQRHSTERSNILSAPGRPKPIVSADYIVGLTDGEGCFYVLVKPPYNQKGGGLVQLSFFIKLREDDRELLEKVKNTFGCGSVYFQHETRRNHTQCYRYTVNSHRDIIGTVIPFFQHHLLQSVTKRRTFDIFCRIAELVQEGKHHDREGIMKIKFLKEQLNRRTR